MAFHCASSAKLALPNMLRSVFRSELSHDMSSGGSPVRRFTPLRQLQHSQKSRSFASSSRFLQSPAATPDSQSSSSSEATSQPANTLDSSTPPQKNHTQAVTSRPGNKPRKTIPETEIKRPKNPKDKEKEKKDGKAKKVPKKPRKPESWEVQKDALGKKFPDGWNPAKRLSPDALDGIRHLHMTAPDRFTTAVLAEEFKVSPEAIRRILKSKWRPSANEMDKRRVRWENRHERIWSQMAELGLRPPTKRSQPLSDTKGLFDNKKK